MRKSTIIALSILLVFSFAGCSSTDTIEAETNVNTEGVASENEITSSDLYSQSSSVVTHYCDAPGCTREGTKRYSGIAGQTEHYCLTHYNEMIDIMSSMEDDVGKSNYSKHTCEECSREGTNSIVGFSGRTEYYCSTHYREIKELLEMLG